MSESLAGNPRVELFTQPGCAPCRAVEAFLEQRGVPYITRDVLGDPAALDAIASEGFMTTPVTRVGDQWVGGFDRARLEGALRATGFVG